MRLVDGESTLVWSVSHAFARYSLAQRYVDFICGLRTKHVIEADGIGMPKPFGDGCTPPKWHVQSRSDLFLQCVPIEVSAMHC